MRRPGAVHSVTWKHHKREIQLGSRIPLVSIVKSTKLLSVFGVCGAQSTTKRDHLQRNKLPCLRKDARVLPVCPNLNKSSRDSSFSELPCLRKDARVLPVCPNLNKSSRDSEVGLEPPTCRSSCAVHLAVFAILKEARRTTLASLNGVSACVAHDRVIVVDDEGDVICVLQIDKALTSINLNTGVSKAFAHSPHYVISHEVE
ncbi:hypothetical protein T265_06034 [Opisthorchis viverrini]|uniref:Uncharacterized protein n=1 Tax=Opisthorchis viverrini TaxID=6198 RepID=A0A074ZHL3_OPIVI|nr:hypothetical protein T265_06034 [Opisthorchis viverrini]KER26748.1 hypothetical protein T265_06034 [Opisthorchis viverrini]